jgi:hypothetical protein
MMWCECSRCQGETTECNAFEPCINAQMENEHKHMKNQMGLDNFWVWFSVIVFVLGIVTIITSIK